MNNLNIKDEKGETRDFLENFHGIFCGLIRILSVQLQAQDKDYGNPAIFLGEGAGKDTIKIFNTDSVLLPATSLYLELGGKVFYSLNVDFRKRENFAFSIGASYFKEDGASNEISQYMLFTSVMAYYLTGNRHRLELGGGLCPGFGSSDGLAAMAVYGNLGYRYQKKKGLIFRAVFTPFLGVPVSEDGSLIVMPWAGLSLGYSF